MGAPELAAVVATVLAAAGVSPQCVRLARTGDPEGVSLPGAALGVVTEAAWVAFMVEHHIWSAVTMPVLMVLANASLVYWIVRAGCDVRTAFVAVSGWVLVLGAVVGVGGWTTLGFVLGFSYAIQITPTIYSAYRSHVPTGIAPARWLMVMGETSLWMFYGFARHEPSIAIFGIVAWSAAATILLRWTSTHRRVATRTRLCLAADPDHVGSPASSRRVRSVSSSSESRLRNAS